MGEEAVLQNALGLEFIAAVNHGDFAGEIGEEQGFFNGGVAAADDQHLFVAVEEAIAGGAGRNAEALEVLLRWQVQPLGLGAGADDERIAGIDLAAVAFQPDGLVLQADFGDGVGNHFGADMLGLGLHFLHQPGALDDFGKARVILNIGGDGELAAGLDALNENRLQHGAGGVNCSSITRRA